MNRAILTALASIGIAQSLKIPIKRLKTGKWDVGLFFETGGMPSSHSAGVASLTSYIAMKRGLPTIDFALSTIFGLIVMYDAQGIRRQAGELSIRVNDLHEELDRLEGEDKSANNYEAKEEKVKESLGHQPMEVVGGALLGTMIGIVSYCLQKK